MPTQTYFRWKQVWAHRCGTALGWCTWLRPNRHMGPNYGPEKGLLSPKDPKIVCYVYFFFSTLGWMEKSIETNKMRIEIRNHLLYVNWWCSYWHLNEITWYLLQTVITERVQLIQTIECGAGSIKNPISENYKEKYSKNLFFLKGSNFCQIWP